MARAFTLRKVTNEYGLPLIGIMCEGINATTGAVAETQWADANGEAAFTALPDAGTIVHIKIYKAPYQVQWRPDIFLDNVAVSAHHGALTGLGDDDHTQYRLESADHTHQSTGLQGGQLDHGLALTGLTDDDHTQYVLESLYDADSVVTATSNDTPVATTMAEQTVLGRLTGGHPDDIAIGIADDNIVQIDHASVADDDFAKFTAAGLEGRSYSEVLSDLGTLPSIDEDDMVSDSAVHLPTQQSVKAYVDATGGVSEGTVIALILGLGG